MTTVHNCAYRKEVSRLSAEMFDFLEDKNPVGGRPPPVRDEDRNGSESGVTNGLLLSPEDTVPESCRGMILA